jgi:plasmid stabilization system protein ParE
VKVVYAEEALRNLDDISDYIRQNYPTIPEAFRLRLQFVVALRAATHRRCL